MIRLLRFFALGVALDWLTSLSLVFGGCCSNALTLEVITSQYPPFGTLITFAQFLFVTIAGLPKHLSVKPSEISKTRRFVVRYPTRSKIVLNPFRYRLKPRRIPLSSYLIQVIMFLLISLLNNAAFAYQIPMSVHIVFRSGGPVVNMMIGWTLRKTRYTKMQVMSIVVVTIGICLTTLSSMASKPSKPRFSSTNEFASSSVDESLVTFAIGISILSAALVLSGFLGLVQDDTFGRYGRGNWEESMFYLHAMALPMFSFVGSELGSQVRLANASPTIKANIPSALHTLGLRPLEPSNNEPPNLAPLPFLPIRLPSLNIPSVYVPLLANLLTQFVCVSGVNRLSSRVNSLTVTLILAVRKAVSLAISVVLVGNSKGNTYLWAGALAVLLGTIGYAAGSSSKRKSKDE
ncbi:UAA transporter [Schizopora paradoxa]|uniref:UAA transporter n=1 Tax=Schizopora paradoxa TaxID=27342 RepID=A0A0H2REG3_9AGAM|nr:UAA transporter [Schizopora paradoxa]